MSSPEQPRAVAGEPDRLNGWKEIAAHLDKGVRTAQRWEKEYGLPIRRLGRDGGEIVFASKAELDEWQRANERRTQGAAEAATALSETPDSALTAASRALRRGWWIAAGIALAVFATWAAIARLSPPRPARWVVEDGALKVLDRSGRPLWSRPFEFRLDDPAYSQETHPETRVAVRDLDGDGSPEVVFGAWWPSKDPATAFHILNADGSVRRTIRPANRVHFGNTKFSGPWLPHSVFVVDRPGSNPAIFLSFIHAENFPSLLLEVDASGQTLAEYWSDGYVESVSLVTWKGQPALFVTAANNDQSAVGGSLAIFAGGHATGSAPAGDAEHRCEDCPRGAPTEFFAFPRRCMNEREDGTAPPTEARVTVDGDVVVQVSDGHRQLNGGFPSIVIYTLTPSFLVSRIEVVGGALATHEEMEAKGQFQHQHTFSEDLPKLVPVKRWTDGDWVDLPLTGPLSDVLVPIPGVSLPPESAAPTSATSRHTVPSAIRR